MKSAPHFAEYAAEALALGLFMVSACAFTTLLEYPGSPWHAAIPNGDLRRGLIGVAMGLTAIVLIYSPFGRRSGAHMNPAVTLAFLRLGRIAPGDAASYITAQFAGGTLGVLASAVVFGPRLASPQVHYVVTVPGMLGTGAAFAAEFGMSFGLMTLVLNTNASPTLMRWTGVLAGATVALYIALLAPLSGMSINPARTFASAIAAQTWSAWWLYFLAPPLGMGIAAEAFRRMHPAADAGCAKLHHAPGVRCIFCEHQHARPVSDTGNVSIEAGGVPAPGSDPASRPDRRR